METLFFRAPRLVALVLLVIAAAGAAALTSIGRQEDPTITNLFGTVTTTFPGADPERVETLVTAEIEDVLREVPEVDVISSLSDTGISIVSVELGAATDPADLGRIWAEARDDLADLARDLPPGASEPDLSTDGSDTAAIVALSAAAPDLPATIPARYADDLATRLRNVPGTELVEIFGAPEEEVLVTLDPVATAALGLTADDVSRAVAAADAKGRAGRVRGAASELTVTVEGEVRALDRLRDVVLREGPDGRAVRLGQVAEVTRGPRAPVAEQAVQDGRDAVLVAARPVDGLRIDVWAGHLRDELDAVRPTLPSGLSLDLAFDQSTYTADRLREVGVNMALGVGLVVAVLLVTLGLRAALIVATVLPVVTLLSLFTMKLIGLPIQQMSVTGLIVALGLLVDAGIVMTDEIGRRLRRGLARVEAVGGAVRRLAAPLLASTVTTALSFTPLILLPGGAGDFVGSIAVAVVVMLLWSFVVAVTLTPAVAGWTLRADGRGGGLSGGAVARAMRASVAWSVANPVRSIALGLVLPVTGALALPGLTAQFFPGVDRDQFTVEIDLPPGAPLAATRAAVNRLDARLAADPRVESVTWVLGRSAPGFYYNIVGDRDGDPGYAQALVRSASPAATEALLPDLERALPDLAPEAQVLVQGLVQGPPVPAPVELRLVGDDLDALRAAGETLRRVVDGVGAVTLARTTLDVAAPEASVSVDEPLARTLGLDLAAVARQLQAGLDGVTGGSMVEGTEQLPIRVRLGAATRGDLDAVRDLPILRPDAAALSADGRWPALPLSAIAEVAVAPAEGAITRRDGERVNTVQAFIQRAVLPSEALAEVEAAMAAAAFALPEGVRLELGGDSDARADTLGNLFAALPLIVVASVAAVVLTFGSFRLAGVTLAVAGLSAGLSLLALAVLDHPFGLQAIIGVIGSIGVSINAAIILLTGMQADPRARAGDPAGMVDVVMGSSRHIVSTTVTTFGGFLPLIVEGGGFWPPFATAVAGGVLLSTVVSFYVVPPAYALVRPRGRRAMGRQAATGPRGPAIPA